MYVNIYNLSNADINFQNCCSFIKNVFHLVSMLISIFYKHMHFMFFDVKFVLYVYVAYLRYEGEDSLIILFVIKQ